NVFPAGKPVFVNSDSVSMRQADKSAIFSGNVKAWQETNTIFAQELQVRGAGDQISARGNVRMTLYNTGADNQRKTPVLSSSDALLAHKNDRKIDLTGNVKIDDEQRHLTAEHATLFFDANRKAERIEAEQKVVLLEQQPTARKGTGEKATYLVAKRLIYLNGSPATVTDARGTMTAENFAIDLAKNKVDVMSSSAPTQGTYKQP
ncbi:MAG: hypothetical protein JO093_09950, partial [Acidobacteria bacterium]|nr:hypothetical protein [Acidobacteriota bacterium]